MTVCFFGIYDPKYSRNSILIKGLRFNGLEVIECNATLGKVKKYFSLLAKHWKIRKKYDVMVVAFPGYQAIILAKLLTRKPLIFDAFFSIYDSEVLDRKSTNPKTLSALYYWFLDWFSCRLADKVMLDTNTHINYFCELFSLPIEKFIRVWLGADDQIIKYSQAPARDYLLVHFHGIATPLQGVGYILAAAKLLAAENIKFNLIGNKIKKQAGMAAGNINFIKTVAYRELVDIMAEADVCLGIFGDSRKTQAVIPNKVYEALASGKAIITADTPAIRELLIDKVNCLFCRAADAKDLADKIRLFNNDGEKRRLIAENGYRLFLAGLTPQKVTLELAEFIKSL